MKVRFKRLTPDAEIPRQLNNLNSGLVLVATSKVYDGHGNARYGTGISVDIPEGYVGLLLPLTGNYKKDLVLSSSLGTVMPGNNEELVFRFRPVAFFADEPKEDEDEGVGKESNTFDYIGFGKQFIEDTDNTSVYNIGDRVGQLLIIPKPSIELEEITEVATGTLSNDVPYQYKNHET